jgi:hypothetical protein
LASKALLLIPAGPRGLYSGWQVVGDACSQEADVQVAKVGLLALILLVVEVRKGEAERPVTYSMTCRVVAW